MTLGKLPLLRVRLSVRKTGEKRAQLLVGKRALAKKLPLSAFNSEIREAFEGLAPDQDVICLPDEHPDPATVRPAPASQQAQRVTVVRDRSLYFGVIYVGFGAWFIAEGGWLYAVVYPLLGVILLFFGRELLLHFVDMDCPRCGGRTEWKPEPTFSSEINWRICRACGYRIFYE